MLRVISLVVQALRGGLSETVTVSSSDTSVGTISPATITIAGGGYTGSTQFTPVNNGSTLLSVSVPADLEYSCYALQNCNGECEQA